MKRYSIYAFDYGGGITKQFWTYKSALTWANDHFTDWDCIEITDRWRKANYRVKWIERTPIYEMDLIGGPGRLAGFVDE